MSLASRVADLATRIGQELRLTRGGFTPHSTNVASAVVTVRKQFGVVTFVGNVTFAADLAPGTVLRIGQIMTPFNPADAVGAGAYFSTSGGAAGAIQISTVGWVDVVHHGAAAKRSCSFAIVYERA